MKSKNIVSSESTASAFARATLSYDRKSMEDEFNKFKEEYKKLEETNDLSSDPQKPKEFILFLVTKNIFIILDKNYQFSKENSVFKVAEIKEDETPLDDAEQMSQVIDKLTEHLKGFVDELQQKVENNEQKIREFLASVGEERETLERNI